MTKQPNILFIISDDHARNAVGCYGSRYGKLTPQIDRIAEGGARLDNVFNTNAICSPSRACILTGAYGHINGVVGNADHFDGRQDTMPKRLQVAGYQTAIFGKWHLQHGDESDPTGFDEWSVLPHQGDYFDPAFLDPKGETKVPGYVTDIITDKGIDWLERRDPDKPFLLWLGHKAPHRSWEPDERHAKLWEEREMPEPETLFDDYATRGPGAEAATMRVNPDLNAEDLKGAEPPSGLSEEEVTRWRYQRHIKDYLRVCASMDDNIGRVLDYLDANGLTENTLIVYTSDHGLFLGEHGWFDKRFMYEEALTMPFVIRYPKEIRPGTVIDDMVLNIDFPTTFLDYAGLEPTAQNQGASFRAQLRGETAEGWRDSIYYRYWCHKDWSHNTYAHRGVRTERFKLIHFYNSAPGIGSARDERDPDYWEFYDLENDPHELNNRIDDPACADQIVVMKEELERLRLHYGDELPVLLEASASHQT